MTSVTRPCFTAQHQTCKTKTDFFWSQTGLVLRTTVSDHITDKYSNNGNLKSEAILRTFFGVDLHLAEVEKVDVVRRCPLHTDESSPDRLRAGHVGRLAGCDGTRVIAAAPVERRRRVSDAHLDITNSSR